MSFTLADDSPQKIDKKFNLEKEEAEGANLLEQERLR